MPITDNSKIAATNSLTTGAHISWHTNTAPEENSLPGVPTLIIVAVTKGSAKIALQKGMSHKVSESTWILFSGIQYPDYTLHASTSEFLTLRIDISPAFLDELTSARELRCLVCPKSSSEGIHHGKLTPQHMPGCLRLRENSSDTISDLLQNHAAAWELAHQLIGSIQSAAKLSNVSLNQQEKDKLEQIRVHLLQRIESECSICELCQVYGLNEFKLKEGFKALYHTTVFSYLKDEKLRHTAKLLENHECNVTEAAVRIGYTNVSHFSAAFKKKFGITPKKFQQQFK